MKLEQLEKIVKANFAVTKGWNIDKTWDIGTDAALSLFVHFAKRYCSSQVIAEHLKIDVDGVEMYYNLYDKNFGTLRFRVKVGLVENALKL